MHQIEKVSIATAICVLGFWSRAAEEPPGEWIESATGHRVIRLSRKPATSSFYFHQNAYTTDGDKMVVSTRDGLSTIQLQTREIEPIVEGRAGNALVGRNTRQVSLPGSASLKPKNWSIFRSTITNSNRTSPSRRRGNGLSFARTCTVPLTSMRSR